MAKHKVITTDAEIDGAIERAAAMEDEPRVIAVEYRAGAGLDLLILKLSNGHRHLIPREDIEGLQGASREQIAKVQIVGNGFGLHWPGLNLDHYVPALMSGLFASQRWMAAIGRASGSARTPATRKASLENGLKGGRPKRNPVAQRTA